MDVSQEFPVPSPLVRRLVGHVLGRGHTQGLGGFETEGAAQVDEAHLERCLAWRLGLLNGTCFEKDMAQLKMLCCKKTKMKAVVTKCKSYMFVEFVIKRNC